MKPRLCTQPLVLSLLVGIVLAPLSAHAICITPNPGSRMELHFGPNKIELKPSLTTGSDEFCVTVNPDKSVSDLLVIDLFPIGATPYTFDSFEITPTLQKLNTTGLMETCADNYTYESLALFGRLYILIMKANVPTDEYACFNIKIDKVGQLDPRARIVSSSPLLKPVLENRRQEVIDQLLNAESGTVQLLMLTGDQSEQEAREAIENRARELDSMD